MSSRRAPLPGQFTFNFESPPRPAAPKAPGLLWPPLQKVTKVVGADGKKRPEVVTQMTGDEFHRVVASLAVTPPWSLPHPAPVAWDGAPFDWPRVVDQDVLLALVKSGALVVVSDSGGKDSQAQGILLSRLVPREQLLFIHATLPGVEWPGTLEQAEGHARAAGAPFHVVQAKFGFLEGVERRFAKRPDAPSWPDPARRSCTKSFKTGPIESNILAYAKHKGFTIVVDATGVRALESDQRARQPQWKLYEGKSLLAGLSRGKAVGNRRLWLKYLPIHHLSRGDVFQVIAAAGQRPHPAYLAGNERLSCVFCVLGSKEDLRRGAEHNPELYAQYLDTQDKVGWKFRSKKVTGEIVGVGLEEIVGLTREEARARKRSLPMYPAHKPFHPAMIPSERADYPEVSEGVACGAAVDEWAPEEDGSGDPDEDTGMLGEVVESLDEDDTKPNGIVCSRHAHLAW